MSIAIAGSMHESSTFYPRLIDRLACMPTANPIADMILVVDKPGLTLVDRERLYPVR